MKEKEKKRKNTLSKIFCVIGVVASLITVLALPSLALSTGTTTSDDLRYTEFPSAVIEQTYVNGNLGTYVTYANQYSLPYYLGSATTGYTYITPSVNGAVQSPLTVNYNYYPNANTPVLTYQFNIGVTSQVWGTIPASAYTGTPFVIMNLGSYYFRSDTPLNESQYWVSLVFATSNFDYNTLALDDLNLWVNLSFKYDEIHPTTGNVSTESVSMDMPLFVEHMGSLGVDNYELYSVDVPVITLLRDELMGTGVNSVYDIKLSYTGSFSTDAYGQDLVPINYLQSSDLRIRSVIVESTLKSPDHFKTEVSYRNGDITYVDNDFNPLNWVINVGGAFLNMPLFATASGATITIGLIFGSIVVCFAVVVILKIYWGG